MTLAPLALTPGDPAGIGAEIALAAWASREVRHPFFLIGDAGRMKALSPVPVQAIEGAEETLAIFPRALPVLHHPLAAHAVPGVPDPANAAATVSAIERAVDLALAGAASAVVTNPINKKALYDGAGFPFPGHTEFLCHLGGAPRSVMMLAGPELRVVPVTIHIPLAEVPAALTTEAIIETARIVADALKHDFAVPRPRIAVAGLNPHAGEGGALGREEVETIAPAVARLREEGFDVHGPLPGDTMFHARARAGYDVALAMYHDQALIPLKALDFERGVNVTLGLPFIRTSPDHGTAYDIAGLGIASPVSLIEALNLASEMAERRSAAA